MNHSVHTHIHRQQELKLWGVIWEIKPVQLTTASCVRASGYHLTKNSSSLMAHVCVIDTSRCGQGVVMATVVMATGR